MGLKQYRVKRNFKSTAEPAGSDASQHKGLMFVVQKHDATRLHYDFRLEMEGVLKSWAVPKGFPWKKGDRRLAVQVEDHPFDYKDFEGIIPEGNYGAGTVMLWDHGTYTVGGGDPLRALEQGKLHLFLAGKKLRDEWTLVRLRGAERDDKPQWLLLKSRADSKPLSAKADDTSVVSGRSLKQIAKAADREWESNRPTKKSQGRKDSGTKASASASPPKVSVGIELEKLSRFKGGFVPPMKAESTKTLPTGDEWIYEVKFDGVRALAVKNSSKVGLYSRAENDLTSKYEEIASSVAALPVRHAVLDGEVAALDEQGRSSFQLLQSYHSSARRPPLVFYVFDVLALDGRDLRTLPLLQRKLSLEELVKYARPNIRFSPALTGDVDVVVKEMQARGLEGLMAKRWDSTYETGRRSSAWRKFKWVAEQEFVIGGYTEPKGGRSGFGALVVGYYEGRTLLYAGKVGTGFDEAGLAFLYSKFQPLIRIECPFANLPEKRTGRAVGLTASQMRLCTWLEPRLVSQVRFAEWTRDNHLRQPSFVGLREDKNPREVIRETPRT